MSGEIARGGLGDGERDAIALVRAYNEAGGEIDGACEVILGNADPVVLSQVLLGMTWGMLASVARLAGSVTDEEIRAAIEEQVISLQATVTSDPGYLQRDFRESGG